MITNNGMPWSCTVSPHLYHGTHVELSKEKIHIGPSFLTLVTICFTVAVVWQPCPISLQKIWNSWQRTNWRKFAATQTDQGSLVSLQCRRRTGRYFNTILTKIKSWLFERLSGICWWLHHRSLGQALFQCRRANWSRGTKSRGGLGPRAWHKLHWGVSFYSL